MKYEDPEAEKHLSQFSDRKLWRMLLKGCWREFVSRSRQVSPQGNLDGGPRIISVISKGAVPELMWTVENYNVVKFDNAYYALPHGVPIDWESGLVASQPGVLVSRTLKEVMDELDKVLGSKVKGAVYDEAQAARGSGPSDEYSQVPVLLGSLEDYNLVSYEGWIYGIPQSLGAVDLMETDIMEMPGVLRDVSRDAVENEIQDRTRAGQAVA